MVRIAWLAAVVLVAGAAPAHAEDARVELRDVKARWSGHNDEAAEIPLVTAVVRNRTKDLCVMKATGQITFLGRDGKPVGSVEVNLLSQVVQTRIVNLPGMVETSERQVLLVPMKATTFKSRLKVRLPDWKEGSLEFQVVKVETAPAAKCGYFTNLTAAQRTQVKACRQSFFDYDRLAKPYYDMAMEPAGKKQAAEILDSWCRRYALDQAPLGEALGKASEEIRSKQPSR